MDRRIIRTIAFLCLATGAVLNAAQLPGDGIEHARLAGIRTLEGELYHVQGMDMDDEHIWVTSVDKANHKGYLHQFNRRTAKLERVVDVSDGPRFHPGGISLYGNSIWVPVGEYRPDSTAVLAEYDKQTLLLKRRIAVADHLGCVAVNGDTLVAGNWGSRKFYVFDKSGKQLRVIANPSSNQYQDIKFVRGALVGSGNITKTTGAVEWLAWPSLKRVRSLASGMTDRGNLYTREAMTLKGNDLYLLPEDGPSRLFHFVLSRP